MPPHSFFWGHLRYLQRTKSQLPSDAHIIHTLSKISKEFPGSDSVYYLDMWPFSSPFMVLSSPSTASQAIHQNTLLKPGFLTDVFHPITGGLDLIFMNGENWKRGRNIFNPGFNPRYLVSLVPAMVEEAVIFEQILGQQSQHGCVFQMDPVVLNLTFDIIARITLSVTQLYAMLYVPLTRTSGTSGLIISVRHTNWGLLSNHKCHGCILG